LFKIENIKAAVDEVHTMTKDSVKYITIGVLYLQSDVTSLLSELYYRNSAGNAYADVDEHKCDTDIERDASGNITSYNIKINKPIFKNKQGKRLMLPEKD
jgi:hypothetical protein